MRNNLVTKRRKCFSSALAGVCLVFSISAAVAAPPSTVEGTYGTVAIGDFPGMLDRASELANKVKPGLTGELVRGQLGLMLGDEGLKSISSGSGLIVTIPQSGKPFLLLETAEGKAETVAGLLQQKGLMAEKVSDKLVAAATDQPSLDNAKGAMGQAAAAKLDGNDDKFIVATIDTDKLIQDKGARLRELLKSLPQKAMESGDGSSTAPAQMLSFFGNLITAVGKRTDVATLKVDISGDGVQFEKTLYPLGGVKLDEPTGPTGQELTKALPFEGDAAMRYESYIDTQSAVKAIAPIIFEAAEGTGATIDKAALSQLITLASEAFGDACVGWVNFEDDKQNGSYLVTVQDQAKALQYITEASKSLSGGAAADFYGSLGITTSATLTKNVATVDGQPAHRLTMSMEGAGVESNPFMKLYNMQNTMITMVENKMLLTMGEVSLEETAQAVKSGSAGSSDLKARSELPAGGDLYIDYNIAAMGETMAKQNAELGQVFESLKDSPILEAAYIDQESIKLMMVIPDELITKAAEGFQGFAQKMQQQQMQDAGTTGTENETPTEVDTGITTGTE